MAINRADILARTFTLPEQPNQTALRQPTAGAADKYDRAYFGIPAAAEGLQWTDNVGELSNRYYQKLSAIDQYAKSMWLNNKIDVTKPDFSNPQAVRAAQAYQQELGNIMSLADELKQSQTMLKSGYDASLTGNYDLSPYQGDQPYARVAGTREGGTFTGLTEPYQEAVKQFSGGRETSGIMGQDQKQFDARMRAMEAQAQQLAQTNPDAAQNLLDQVQRARLAQNMYVNPPAQYDAGAGLPAVSSLSEIADLFGGGHPTFQESDKILNGVKAKSSINNPAIGIDFQGKQINGVYHAKDKTYLGFNDGTTKEINKDNVYSYLVAVANKTGEQPQLEKFMQNALTKGWAKPDRTGLGYVFNVPIEKIMSEKGKQLAASSEFVDMKDAIKQAETNIASDIDNVIRFNNRSFWKFGAAPEYIYPLPSGLSVKVAPSSNKKIQVQIIDPSGKVYVDPKGAKWSQEFESKDKANKQLQDWGVYELAPLNTSTYLLQGKKQQPTSELQIGQEDSGFRYLGGDPSLPTSWEEIK